MAALRGIYDPGVDLIVCGEALWVSCGTWIGFWSGAIGAFVAAVLGGVVALVVVRLTNAQQRHGVDRTVEVAAAADFIAAVEELEWAVKYRMKDPETFDPGSYVLLMRAATTRLHLARVESQVVADVLVQWPEKMHGLVQSYRLALMKDAPEARDIVKALSSASTGVTVVLPFCLSRSKTKQKAGLQSLKDADRTLDLALERFEGLWKGSVSGTAG